MPLDPIPSGWSEYQMLVLAELKRHNEVLEMLAREIGALKVELALFERHHERLTKLETGQTTHDIEIARLEVKAGLWGALAGLIAAVGAALMHLFRG